MADNVVVTAGTGTTIAADEVTDGTLGSVKVQYVKLMDGTLDGTTKAAVGASGLAVNASIVAGQTLATVTTLGTISNALPAGTNAIGKLAANSGVDIGDVDVTTVPTDPFGANADAASATGSISAKLRGLATAIGTTAWDLGSGTGGTRTQRTIIDSSQLGTLGQAAKTASVPVVPATDYVYNTGYYVAVAASQTDSVIQSSAGASGDYLDHIVVVPATTAAGVVTIKDNATALISYPGGGTTALLTLTPFIIYVGAVSRSGAWKVTTGANVSILAVGRFS